MFSVDPAAVLLTLAEVSVAFAGFASLIAILGLRTDTGTKAFDLLRYWVMLEFSLAALALSLLPLLLTFLGIAEVVIWRGSSALVALFVLIHHIVVVRLYFRREPALRRATHPANLIGANLTYAALVLTQVANALGFLDPPFGWYLLGLLLVLFVASAHFIIFIAHAIETLRGS
jgi:hypothetical protein